MTITRKLYIAFFGEWDKDDEITIYAAEIVKETEQRWYLKGGNFKPFHWCRNFVDKSSVRNARETPEEAIAVLLDNCLKSVEHATDRLKLSERRLKMVQSLRQDDYLKMIEEQQ